MVGEKYQAWYATGEYQLVKGKVAAMPATLYGLETVTSGSDEKRGG